MKKYDYQRSIRLNDDVKQSLEKICEVYRVNESDYIRNSLEKNLIVDMQSRGLKPTFFHSYKLRKNSKNNKINIVF